jgi:hypothetical protein
MTLAPLKDLGGPRLTPPTGLRSAQRFLVEVVVRAADMRDRAVAHGQDIYAVAAPIVVEAMRRLIDSRTRTAGVVTVAEISDSTDFLHSLSPNTSRWSSLSSGTLVRIASCVLRSFREGRSS